MTAAVIPTIGRSPYLLPLLVTLLADGIRPIYLPDNGDRPDHGLDRLLHEQAGDWSQVRRNRSYGLIVPYRTDRNIYESWNYHLDRHSELAVLNDDVIVARGSVDEACAHLTGHRPLIGLNYDRPVADGAEASGVRDVTGTWRAHGMGGFAFVALSDDCGRVSTGFQWWYGDDDLVLSTLALGKRVAVALGAPVEHPSPSLSSAGHVWMADAIAADTALFRELHPYSATAATI